MTESEATQIIRAVESIEHGEEWRDGEPTLGTCKALATIKQIARTASAAEKQAGGVLICASCRHIDECPHAGSGAGTPSACALWEAK